MLDVFRNAAKGWAAKILIGLLALSFGIWGIADVFTGYSTGALATVGDQEIQPQAYTNAFRDVQQNYSRQTGENLTSEQARLLGIDRQVLGDLIRDAALDAQASNLKLAISDEELAQEVASNPSFQDSQGKFDPAGFRALLERNNMNEAMFFAMQRQQRQRQALTGSATADFTPPDAMIEAVFRHRNEERDAKYFIVKAAESELPAATDAELKEQYEKNPQSYTAPEYRSIAMFKIEPQDIAIDQRVTDDEVKAGYERYKQDYHTPETRTILQITFPTLDEAKKAKERITAGTDFMAIAKERGLTEADATLTKNGTKQTIIDPVIGEAAFKLKQGEVSDPVEGKLAIALLKAEAVSPEHQKTMDEVKLELIQRLQLDKAREQIQSVYDAVEDARAAQTPFEEIAKKGKLPFTLIAATDAAGLGPDGTPVEMPYKDKVVKASFSSDVGVENDALAEGDGYIWYEVRSSTPSAVKPLETVKDQVKADLTARKLRELALDKGKKLADRAKGSASLESLAQEAGATVQSVQGLKRSEASPDFGSEAVSALFSVPENGFAFALENDGKGARIIQSQAVLKPTFDPKSAEAESIRKALGERTAQDVLSAYLDSLQKTVGVSINENLWRQIAGMPNS